MAAANLDANRIAQGLIEHGLDLIRDTRFAHANAVMSGDRLALARETQTLRRQILEITEARLEAAHAAGLRACFRGPGMNRLVPQLNVLGLAFHSG